MNRVDERARNLTVKSAFYGVGALAVGDMDTVSQLPDSVLT